MRSLATPRPAPSGSASRPRVRRPSRSRRHPWTAATAALVLALLPARTARATAVNGPDPIFGRDKVLHFTASAVLAAGGYATGVLLDMSRLEASLLGGGIGLGAGIAKEAFDIVGLGTPSAADLGFSAAGAATGVALSLLLDVMVRGADPTAAGTWERAATSAHGVRF